MPQAGRYKGKAIRGKTQLGETDGKGTLQIAIDLDLTRVVGEAREPMGAMTTLLYFTDASAVYAYERLRALGWKGLGADDIDKLDDIYDTEVDCEVSAPEAYIDPNTKERKMGTSKVTILTGGGTFVISKPVTPDSFKARLKALGGGGGGGSPPPASDNTPPF